MTDINHRDVVMNMLERISKQEQDSWGQSSNGGRRHKKGRGAVENYNAINEIRNHHMSLSEAPFGYFEKQHLASGHDGEIYYGKNDNKVGSGESGGKKHKGGKRQKKGKGPCGGEQDFYGIVKGDEVGRFNRLGQDGHGVRKEGYGYSGIVQGDEHKYINGGNVSYEILTKLFKLYFGHLFDENGKLKRGGVNQQQLEEQLRKALSHSHLGKGMSGGDEVTFDQKGNDTDRDNANNRFMDQVDDEQKRKEDNEMFRSKLAENHKADMDRKMDCNKNALDEYGVKEDMDKKEVGGKAYKKHKRPMTEKQMEYINNIKDYAKKHKLNYREAMVALKKHK